MSELTARKLERPTQYPESTLKTVLIAVVVVAALYLGREVLIPIALAILLTFVLAPLVRLLQRWYFPRIIAVALVGLVAFAAIFGLGALMVSQLNQLATDYPDTNRLWAIRSKVCGASSAAQARLSVRPRYYMI
jgi:predicted PurR-regulated permease PerM